MSVEQVERDPRSTKSKSKRRRWGLLALLLIGSGIIPSTGCTAWTGIRDRWQYSGFWNDSMMTYRNSSYAAKSWHRRKHCYANQRYLRDFACGFRSGYLTVAEGSDPCTPSFPPREYWGWRYQSCEGQAKVAAWFSGFPHGARAAEEDGIGNFSQIQTSSHVQSTFVQHGMLAPEYNGMYPVPRPALLPAAAVPNGGEMILDGAIISTDGSAEGTTQIIPMADPSTY